MQTRRWTNPSQPQTLQIAVFLFYIDAVFSVLFGAVFSLLGLILTVAFVASGFGIANERKWGYIVGVIVAALALVPIALSLAIEPSNIVNPYFLLQAVFPVALFALLMHPMSREYQRIWFK